MNIGIFAHVDAGKTTVTENLLYESGAIKKIGKVDSGNTVTDKMALEKKRGISIQSTPVSFDYKDVKINLIDTPGHIEFIAEVERAMSVLDGAVLVVSGKEGVQSHTMLLFESLKRLKIPVIIFINKMDRMGVVTKEVIENIKKELTRDIVIVQDVKIDNNQVSVSEILESKMLLEDLSLFSDEIMEHYINEDDMDNEVIQNTLRELTLKSDVHPVCFGSALNNIGMKELLDAIHMLLPKLSYKAEGDLEGVVFKILRNEQGKREIYIRLYGGFIQSRGLIGDEKVSFIKSMRNGKLDYSKVAYGNDIVVIMGPRQLKVGDVIGHPKAYNKISLGTPTLRTRIISEDHLRLTEILDLLSENDPFLEYDLEVHSKDLYINLFGDIQMEIIGAIIKDNHQMNVTFDEPEVIYKEMPVDRGEYALHMYTKDHPFYATVGLRVEPWESGITIDSEVTTGYLPKSFQSGIHDGIKSALREGLKGWEVTNIKITLIEGAFNSVDSTPADFRNLSPLVVMEALNKCGSKLLWPVNQFKIKIDHEHYGKVMSDLLMMKSTDIETTEDVNKFVITGIIPVETSMAYDKKFISLTSGLGMISQTFYKYVEAPKDLIKTRKKNHVDPLDRGKYLLTKLGTSS